jgi:hypothetical protein
VVAVLALAVTQRTTPHPQPVVIAALAAPHADDAACQALLAALPQRLGDYQRATPAEPVPAGTAAWLGAPGGDPVVLRCGLDRPADFVVGAPIQLVDAVQWFRVGDSGGGRSTWFAVDRPVYIALTLPDGSGPTPIQQLSELIAATAGAVPIDPGTPPP